MQQGGSWGQAGVRKERSWRGQICGGGHFKTSTIELNYFSKFFAPSVKTLS